MARIPLLRNALCGVQMEKKTKYREDLSKEKIWTKTDGENLNSCKLQGRNKRKNVLQAGSARNETFSIEVAVAFTNFNSKRVAARCQSISTLKQMQQAYQ